MFNSFSDTYLRIFQSCFPIKQKPIHHNHKPWLTQGIRISCANKKKLYETYKYSKEPNFKIYYKKYCKILTSTIEVSKRKYYDNLISKSTNKTKTIWNLVKTITNKSKIRNTIASMNINNHSINDPDTITNSFNSFFASVAQNFLHEQPSNNFTQDPIRNLNSNVLKSTTSLHFSPTSTN